LKWVPCGSGMPEGCEVAVLHGNPKTGASEVFVCMPQGYRFPAHWHTANERITMVKGTMSLTVKGGEVINARPGTYLFLPGKTAHSGQCGDTEACVLSVALDKPLDIHAAGAKHR
jgi:quercetin dioxygenase-like cupin family protein